MQIYVYSRNAIRATQPHEVPHIVISITSAADDEAPLRKNENCIGILRLSFPDADAPTDQFPEAALFSEDDATRIWNFVREHQTAVERILIRCDAGVSRSAAVGAALSKVLNDDDSEFFGGRYRPNARVYKMLLEAKARITVRPPSSSQAS